MITNSQIIPFNASPLTKVMRASALSGALSATLGSSIGYNVVGIPLAGFCSIGTSCLSICLFDGIETGHDVNAPVENFTKILGGVVGSTVGATVGLMTQNPALGGIAGALTGGLFGGAYHAGICFFGKKNIGVTVKPEANSNTRMDSGTDTGSGRENQYVAQQSRI